MTAKDSHGTYTMNRLKNENPGYVIVGKLFLTNIKERFGTEAYEIAMEMVAECYRVLELSEKYPDKTKQFIEEQRIAEILLADPPLDKENANVDNALRETDAMLNKFGFHKEK